MYYLILRSVTVFFQVVNLLLVLRVILSWVRFNNYNKYVSLLYQLTDPILEPFKRLSNRFLGGNQMVDWSPLIAMLVIQYFIQPLVLTLIGVFF
ncbi:MAG: hypothetical protein K0R84_2233 [Clostridia bacterium]|nr:hypothetical protein [Clostridia bacterium]